MKAGFVFTIEGGKLEEMSLLLSESIRKYGGSLSDAPIWAIQTTLENPLKIETKDGFQKLGVTYRKLELNKHLRKLRPSNKVYSAAFVEEEEKNLDVLILLDCDTLCVNPPIELILGGQEKVAISPVDVANIGQDSQKPIAPYWSMVFKSCGLRDDRLWQITSRVDTKRIFGYFNSGVIAARPTTHLFSTWRNNLEVLFDRKEISRMASYRPHFSFLDQSSLAATIMSLFTQGEVKLLPATLQYPLHLQKKIPTRTRLTSLSDAAIVHYHGAFYNLEWLKSIRVDGELLQWLLTRLPLRNDMHTSSDQIRGIIRKLLRPLVR